MPKTSKREHWEIYCEQCGGQRITTRRNSADAIRAQRRHNIKHHKGIPTRTIGIQWPQSK